jgi:hypothetical protein
MLTTRLHLSPRLSMHGTVLPFPLRLHGVGLFKQDTLPLHYFTLPLSLLYFTLPYLTFTLLYFTFLFTLLYFTLPYLYFTLPLSLLYFTLLYFTLLYFTLLYLYLYFTLPLLYFTLLYFTLSVRLFPVVSRILCPRLSPVAKLKAVFCSSKC